jgi:hypothetical protein
MQNSGSYMVMWFILNAIGMDLRAIYRELSAVAAFVARFVPVKHGKRPTE